MLRTISILSILLILPDLAHAQTKRSNRIVTTDYNQCLMGVKDTTGAWVIQPVYEYITKMALDEYKVSSGGKYGVVDTNGAVIIPMMYERLENSYASYDRGKYYRVYLNDKCGVARAGNEIVVPIKYDVVNFTSDSTFAAREGKRTWFLYREDGSFVPLRWKSKSGPSSLCNDRYRVTKRRRFSGNRYGMTDDSGNVMLKRKYSSITSTGSSGLIALKRHGKKGYITPDGKEVWPMIFDADRPRRTDIDYYDYNYVASFRVAPDGKYYGIETINKKFGVVSSAGDTVLPFIYTDISYFNFASSRRPHVLKVEQGNKSGLFEIGKGWVIPIEFEEMTTVSSFYTAADSMFVAYFTAKQNGRYGMQTSTGEVIVPFDFMGFSYADSRYVFFNPDSIVQFTFAYSSSRANLVPALDSVDWTSDAKWQQKNSTSRRLIPPSAKFSIHRADENLRVYYNPLHMNDTIFGPDTFYFIGANKYLKNGLPDSVLNSAVYYVRTEKPAQTLSNGDRFYQYSLSTWNRNSRSQLTYVVYRKPSGLYDLDWTNNTYEDEHFVYYRTRTSFLVRNDGRIICDRYKYPVLGQARSTNGEGTYFHGVDGRVEVILDHDGNIVVPPSTGPIRQFNSDYAVIDEDKRFSRARWVVRNNHTQEVVYRCAKGNYSPCVMFGDVLLDYSSEKGNFAYNFITKQTIIDGMNDVISLNDSASLFCVRTCSGKLGVVDRKNNWLVDTLYDYFTTYDEVGAAYRIDSWSSARTQTFYRYVILYTASRNVVFDNVTGTILQERTELFNSMISSRDVVTMDTISEWNEYHHYESGKTRLFMTVPQQEKLLQWHREVMFDSIFSRIRSVEGLDPYYTPLDYSCQYCVKKRFPSSFYMPGNFSCRTYYTHFVSDSLVSFSGSSGSSLRWFSNAVLYPEGPRSLTLNTLFSQDSDWRNFIINAVLNYVNNHIRVRGDCHNPAAFPILLNDRFLTSPEGIQLYPLDFTEDSKQLMILVPWKDADPYLNRSVKSKLPIPINN